MLIDPLDPPPDVRHAEHVLITVYWHGRSTSDVDAKHVWAPKLGPPLRLCPECWLGTQTHDDLRAVLRPLLELPIERVLVSHGEPVLSGGGKALAAVLA